MVLRPQSGLHMQMKLSECPEGFIQLARSNICECEAMRHEDRPIFGGPVASGKLLTQKKRRTVVGTNFFEVCENY